MKRLIAAIPLLFLLVACKAAAKPSTTATPTIIATKNAPTLLSTLTPSTIISTRNVPTVRSTPTIGKLTATPSTTPTLNSIINTQNVSQIHIVRELDANAGAVYRVAFSPQGDLLASVGEDQKIRAWDVKTGEIKYTISQPEDGAMDFAFNQDGTRLITGKDDTLSIWDTATGELVGTEKTGGCCISEIEASPDGKYLAVLGYPKLEFYDLKTLTGTISSWSISDDAHFGFLTLSMDNNSFAYAEADQSYNVTLQIYDTRWASTIPAGDILLYKDLLPMGYVYGLTYSAHNQLLWASDGGIGVASLRAGAWVNCNVLGAWSIHTTGLAFSPDKRLLAAGNTDGELSFIDGNNYEPLVKFQLAHKLISGITFNAPGNLMAVSSYDGAIVLLDIGNEVSDELVASHDFGKDVEISAGFFCLFNEVSYSASLTKTPELVARATTQPEVKPTSASTSTAAPSVPTLTPTSTPGIADSLSPNGPWLLYTRNDPNGQQIIRLTNADGSGRKEIFLPSNAYIENLNTALSPNGEWLAFYSGYAGDKDINWNNSGGVLSQIKPPYDLSLYLMHLPDGAVRRISSLLSPDYPTNFDKVAQFVLENDPEYKGYEIKEVKGEIVEIFLGGIRELAWSPGGGYLAFASEADGPTSDLYIYDMDQGVIKRLTDGYGQITSSLSWSPDNKWIVHSSSNGPVGEGWMPALYAARTDGSEVQAFNEVGYGWGWADPGIYMIFDDQNVYGSFNLRNIDLETNQSYPVWPYSFEGFAYDPIEDITAVVSACSIDSPGKVREGIYLIDSKQGLKYVMPGFSQITFRGGSTDRFVLNGWGSPIIGISKEGITTTISTQPSAVSVSPNLKWMVLLNQKDNPSLELYDENDVFIRQLTTGAVNNIIWHPLSTAIFYTQGKNLYTISIPDGNPILIDNQLPTDNSAVVRWVP